MTKDECTFTIHCGYDDLPVKGNAMASGDEAFDREVEEDIYRRVNDGNVWAWGLVTVTAEIEGFVGKAHLGACSYESEEDFKTGLYYEQLCDDAFEDLQDEIEGARERLHRIGALG